MPNSHDINLCSVETTKIQNVRVYLLYVVNCVTHTLVAVYIYSSQKHIESLVHRLWNSVVNHAIYLGFQQRFYIFTGLQFTVLHKTMLFYLGILLFLFRFNLLINKNIISLFFENPKIFYESYERT